MKIESYVNVWDALADTEQEAANLTLRSDLMSAIAAKVKTWGVPPKEAAHRLGLTRPRLEELMRGKLDKFSLDALVGIVTAAGFKLRFQLNDDA